MAHIPFTKNTKTKAKNGQHDNGIFFQECVYITFHLSFFIQSWFLSKTFEEVYSEEFLECVSNNIFYYILILVLEMGDY